MKKLLMWAALPLVLVNLSCATVQYVHLKDGTALRAKTVNYNSDKKEYVITAGSSMREQTINAERVTHVSNSSEGDIILKKMDEQVGGEDLSRIAYALYQDLSVNTYLKTERPPVIAFLHIENKTSEYFNTDIIADKIMELMLNNGKAVFVAPNKRELLIEELKFQLSGLTEKIGEMGKMHGVDFFVYGDISSIEKKQETFSKTKRRSYYRLSLKMLEVKTSIIVWMGARDWYSQKSRGFLE